MAIQYFATKVEAEAVANGQVSWCIVKDGKPWAAATGEDVIIDLRPTVTKWQFVQACIDAGFTEAQLDAAAATLTSKRQRFWKYTNVIDRDNPMSGLLRQAILPTPPTVNQWNAIFVAAAGLNPLQI
jgi:hypothetical protein